jgi:hypothetical protein
VVEEKMMGDRRRHAAIRVLRSIETSSVSCGLAPVYSFAWRESPRFRHKKCEVYGCCRRTTEVRVSGL